MKNMKGFTLIELLIVITVIAIFAMLLVMLLVQPLLNTRGATERRAAATLEKHLSTQDISGIARKTCAGDSDGDGYGSCTLTLQSGERLYMDCPAGWWAVTTGAVACKELPGYMQIKGR